VTAFSLADASLYDSAYEWLRMCRILFSFDVESGALFEVEG
jgi:hypothetical protein